MHLATMSLYLASAKTQMLIELCTCANFWKSVPESLSAGKINTDRPRLGSPDAISSVLGGLVARTSLVCGDLPLHVTTSPSTSQVPCDSSRDGNLQQSLVLPNTVLKTASQRALKPRRLRTHNAFHHRCLALHVLCVAGTRFN